MSLRNGLLLLAVALLAVGTAMVAARLVDRQRAPRLELAAAQRLALAEGAGAALRNLGDPVIATYFATAPTEMPSSMRRVERDVADSLEALARSSGGLLRWDILRPGESEPVEKLATRYNARPFPVRTVLRDGHVEQSVHSSLVLASGPRPPVTINGITADHAAQLPSLIVAHLERMGNPRRPRIALSAPPGHAMLRRLLDQHGDVTTVNLDSAGSAMPADADLLVWIQPHAIDAVRVRDIELFLEQGRSVVIAGSRRWAQATEDGRRGQFVELPYGLDPLLDAFGLRAVDGLLLDPPRAEARTPLPTGIAGVHMRTIGADQDFRLMSQHLSASVLFAAPTPIVLAEAGASRDGWSLATLATTSDGSVLSRWPDGAFDPGDVAGLIANGDPMPRAPLIAMLRSHDPWQGSMLLIGSTLPLSDAMLDRDGFAHRKLVDIVVNTLASPERLIAIDAWTAPAPPLPELAAASRIGWRLLCIAPLPLVLISIGLWLRWAGTNSGRKGRASVTTAVRVRPVVAPTVAAGVALVAIGAIAALVAAGASRLGVRADLTAEGSNSVAPETLELASAVPPTEMELFANDRQRLPPRLRGPVAALEALVADVAARTPELTLRVIRPETLDTAERSALVEEGIVDSTFTDRDEEITVVRRFTCTLRLRTTDGSGREETLVFLDEAGFEHAEFRLAFALSRLARGRGINVALISDRPRPTPAESHEFFQLQGLQPPMGTDVYSLARQTLVRHDFRVFQLSHTAPTVPDDADLLLWLQPRRPGPMLAEVLSRSLHAGRPAIVAAQHFNIQARLYSGRDNRVVYWPQPQWPDMDGGWFGAIGATMPRLVLLDELQMSSRSESQVMAGGSRSFTEHETSLPFLIRAVAGNFDRTSPLVRGLGDQGFVWGSAIQLDPTVLASRSIVATPLMTTSPRAWTFNWTGGFLPPELIGGPLATEESAPQWAGRLPLAVLLEGRFPVAGPEEFDWIDPLSLGTANPSRLLLIGSSELFKDNRLRDPAFRGDHFLLNTVTALSAEPRLVAVLTRRTVPRGLDYVATDDRLRWRAIAVVSPALALLAFGLAVNVVRRRPSTVAAMRTPLPASAAAQDESAP